MMHLPAIRWGEPYESLEAAELVHFMTGEPVAKVSQMTGGIVQRDMRKASRARQVLKELSCEDILSKLKTAADLYLTGDLLLGGQKQSPADFAKQQSATSGLPESLCHANMKKNHFVLSNMEKILDALTRGLPLDILTKGYGKEARGVTVSYQAQSPVLGLVLPSNSPGVHTLWLPAIPMQIGLVLKPGSQEPWTPYRVFAAMTTAGIPAEAFSIYPGPTDVGGAVMSSCERAMIFGSAATVEKFAGNPRVQVHGPGFSKILLGEDVVDDWEKYLDLMVESVFANSGRGCINCSSIWAPRHSKEIAQAIANRIGPVEVKPPDDPQAALAAFTVPGQAQGVWQDIEAAIREDGVTHVTEPFGPRLVEQDRCAYLRPVVLHSKNCEAAAVKKEYMFPFVTVTECPQDQMIDKIGYTLVGTAITSDAAWRKALVDCSHIDRINLGPIPTIRLDWLQPHEGNIVDFLFRARACQVIE